MNKKIFLLALPAILLTSCNLIEFSDESHDEGFSDGQERKERTVEYFDGDNLSEFEESLKHEITFKPNETYGQTELTTSEEIMSVVIDSDGVISEASNINSVAQYHSLKVGNYVSTIDGTISFSLNVAVSAVEIMARPRWAVTTSGGVTVNTIDDKVAMSVNDSKYIAINCNFNDPEAIVDTKCCYKITKSNSVSINVAFQRLEITKIVLYE